MSNCLRYNKNNSVWHASCFLTGVNVAVLRFVQRTQRRSYHESASSTPHNGLSIRAWKDWHFDTYFVLQHRAFWRQVRERRHSNAQRRYRAILLSAILGCSWRRKFVLISWHVSNSLKLLEQDTQYLVTADLHNLLPSTSATTYTTEIQWDDNRSSINLGMSIDVTRDLWPIITHYRCLFEERLRLHAYQVGCIDC